jgi:hypothetical protein
VDCLLERLLLTTVVDDARLSWVIVVPCAGISESVAAEFQLKFTKVVADERRLFVFGAVKHHAG